MRSAFRAAILLGTVLSVIPVAARAGWVSEWVNQAARKDGERSQPQQSSMTIANDRVRTEQPEVTTVLDCDNGRFTMMNPVARTFWSGTVDQYALSIVNRRREEFDTKLKAVGRERAKGTSDSPPEVDLAKLPPISIGKTDTTAKIAGYDTVKYEVWANGELFYEFWLAPTLDVSKDLNIDRFLAQQRKIGAAQAGKTAGPFNALYLSDEYRKLQEKGFVLKSVTHHIAGSFERTATSMRQADVAASQFEVPATYREVSLGDVLPALPTPAAKPK